MSGPRKVRLVRVGWASACESVEDSCGWDCA